MLYLQTDVNIHIYIYTAFYSLFINVLIFFYFKNICWCDENSVWITSRREQVNFQWDDDEVYFVLDQHA